MQGRSPLVLVSREEFHGGGWHCLGVVFQGGIIQGKMPGSKIPGGQLPSDEISWGANCSRGNFATENFIGGNCPGVVVEGGIF